MTVLHHLQHEARRHRERGDQGDVDPAAQDHDRHSEAENAEHSDVLQQGQHIVGAEEPREEERERNEQDGEDREHDLLLRYADASEHSLFRLRLDIHLRLPCRIILCNPRALVVHPQLGL